MKKDEKLKFIANGGALLRSGETKKGEPCIKVKNQFKDWYPAATCENNQQAIKVMRLLVKLSPERYYIDQTIED